MLEVRPYPRSLSIANLVRLSAPDDAASPDPNIVAGASHTIDVRKLNAALAQVDFHAVGLRRKRYNRLYHEASISDENGRGISFQNCLRLLAHYVGLLGIY